VSQWNRWNRSFTCWWGVLFVTSLAHSVAVFFISTSLLRSRLLWQVTFDLVSCNWCSQWCRNIVPKSWYITAASRWILHFYCRFIFCRYASDQLVAHALNLSRYTWHLLRFVVASVAALSTRTSVTVQILWIVHSFNFMDFPPQMTMHNCPGNISSVHHLVLCGIDQRDCIGYYVVRIDIMAALVTFPFIQGCFCLPFPIIIQLDKNPSVILSQCSGDTLGCISLPESILEWMKGVELLWRLGTCGTCVNQLSFRFLSFLVFRYQASKSKDL